MKATDSALIQANNELVILKNETLVVSHIILAEKTANDKISIRKLIDKNIIDLEEFGKLSFQMTPIKNSKNKENEFKEYFLNEQQATLIITYLRNNEIVREFKKNLVKAFFELREKQNQPVLLQKKLNIKDLSREELEDFAQYVLDKYHEVNENNIYFRQSANKWFDNMNEAISQNLSMKDELESLRKEKENFKQLALDTSKQESEYLAYSFEAVWKELWLSRNKVFDFARLFCMIKKDNMPTKYFKDNFKIIDTEYKSGNWIRKYKQPMFLESWKEIFKKKLQKFLPQTV